MSELSYNGGFKYYSSNGEAYAAQSVFVFMAILRLFLRYQEEISRVIKRYQTENEFGQIDNKFVIKKLDGFILDNLKGFQDYFNSKRLPKDPSNYMILLSDYFVLNAKNETTIPASKMRNNGLDFEKECYIALRSNGYKVTETPKTGDYGADLIASKDGVKFAIQCKDFQTPVGVEAVQQAHAAKEYFTADFSVVVCSSKYTPAAIKMASKLNVICIGKNKLPKIIEICGDFIG